LFIGGRTSTLGQAIAKDENVRWVARFCYPLLRGLLRSVVREPRFIGFAMQNREKLLRGWRYQAT